MLLINENFVKIWPEDFLEGNANQDFALSLREARTATGWCLSILTGILKKTRIHLRIEKFEKL